MSDLLHLRLKDVSDPISLGSRPRRNEPARQWQRRAGGGMSFRFHPRVAPTDGESEAASRAREHLDYLKRMATEGVVPPTLATKAKVVWWIALVSVGGDLPVPAAAAFSGGPVEYHWSVGPHQLTVEIPADGPCHWTYRNSNTGELWGVETVMEDELPPRLVRALTRIVTGSR